MRGQRERLRAELAAVRENNPRQGMYRAAIERVEQLLLDYLRLSKGPLRQIDELAVERERASTTQMTEPANSEKEA
jgi:hypothetical protein